MVRNQEILIVLCAFMLTLAPAFAHWVDVQWPEKWAVWSDLDALEQPQNVDYARFASGIPESLRLGGKDVAPVWVEMKDGAIDFMNVFGSKLPNQTPIAKTPAYALAEIDLPKAGILEIGAGADWWMVWFVDGKPVYDTLATGNQTGDLSADNHVFSVALEPGKHTLGVLVLSGSAGWKMVALGGAKYAERFALARTKIEERKHFLKNRARLIAESAAKNRHMKLAIFGSSVALGVGAPELNGWGNQLKTLLESKGTWSVVNQSVGGDNTTKLLARIDQDLLPEKPDAVIIALSLANEGILGPEPDQIYAQYTQNLHKLMQICAREGIVPIISGCYPNSDYDAQRYQYIQKFNEELATWNVASIHFLGALDDGAGRWKEGTSVDAGHPNAVGHHAMFRSIPPSMFDYLHKDFAAMRLKDDGWLEVKGAALHFVPDYQPHAFSLIADVLAEDFEDALLLDMEGLHVGTDHRGRLYLEVHGVRDQSSFDLEDADEGVSMALVHDYLDAVWTLYADGVKIAQVLDQQVSWSQVTLGDVEQAVALRNVMFYRTALRADELARIARGVVLHSSLELFAPLEDRIVFEGARLNNLAPSAERLRVGKGSFRFIPE